MLCPHLVQCGFYINLSKCVTCLHILIGFKLELLDHDQMKTILWRKLIVNASINPIASILNATNQRVGACEWSRSCVSAIVHEAYAVAKGDNVELGCSVEVRQP